MIEIETAANVADIAGGLAILVSLIYVGYQVRQSNRIAQADSLRAMGSMAFMDQCDMANIGRAFTDFESLGFDAKWEFHTYFLRLWAHYEMILESSELGLITERALNAWTHTLAQIFSTPGTQQYFRSGALGNIKQADRSRAIKIIENYIEKNGETLVPYNQHMKWMLQTG